jgi:hypothetical protein
MANETLKNGGDLSDGRRFARSLYNRIFPSVDGALFNVNNNGDRDSIYAVLGMASDQGNMEVLYLHLIATDFVLTILFNNFLKFGN